MPKEPERFRVASGMDVVGERGASVGRLEGVLVENGTGMGRFLIIDGRLIPVETIEEIQGGRLRVDVTREELGAFPEVRADCPSFEAIQRAYNLIGLPGPLPEGP